MTKTEKKQKCRTILKNTIVGQPIKDRSNIFFLLSVFQKHDHWELKKGAGIKFITSMTTTYGEKCFQIIRVDGSTTDISFIKSIDKPSHLFNIKKALRHAINTDIRLFRDQTVVYGITKCQFTNEILTQTNTHIDHYDLPFRDLTNLWLKSYDLDYLSSQINDTLDNEIDTYFINQKIIDNFRAFHNQNTNLRAVSKTANLTFLK